MSNELKTITQQEVKESRLKALEKVKQLLECEDVEAQFDDYKNEQKIVSWIGTSKNCDVFYSLQKATKGYKEFSGNICILARFNIFFQKSIHEYASYELALIYTGVKLCKNRAERQVFFRKYAMRYNSKLKIK